MGTITCDDLANNTAFRARIGQLVSRYWKTYNELFGDAGYDRDDLEQEVWLEILEEDERDAHKLYLTAERTLRNLRVRFLKRGRIAGVDLFSGIGNTDDEIDAILLGTKKVKDNYWRGCSPEMNVGI